jgi:hypothetical protein
LLRLPGRPRERFFDETRKADDGDAESIAEEA